MPDASRPLTIGLDARAASEVGAGRGRVVRELLRELARRAEPHQYRCYARSAWQGVSDERFEWVAITARDPWWNLLAARRATHECDVFLSSNSYLTTWFTGVPAVPIVYDLVSFDRAMRPNRRSAVIERLTMGLAVRRSAALIAISAATAQALTERFPRAAQRTTIAPLGVADVLHAEGDPEELVNLPAPGFVLAVGTLEPRKNLPRLVEAFSDLAPELQQRHPLVVVGALGWQAGETQRALRSLGERAMAMGYVSDPALAELYRRCALFCYPSLGEGFGLPVLEAMAAGAPVLTSDVSSLPEVGGDTAAYTNPRDAGAIKTALEALLEDGERRREMAAGGPARAAQFSWARFAETVLRTLEAAAQP